MTFRKIFRHIKNVKIFILVYFCLLPLLFLVPTVIKLVIYFKQI